MPPASTTVLRWTDKEHDILVTATYKQIEIEAKDKSKEISWSRHWQKISSILHQHGYSRTAVACQGYWKRVGEIHKANEQAAGPRWDDSEHQILVEITGEQLAREKADPSTVISWPTLWKRVSLRLKEEGYHRSVNACAAYWALLQNDAPLATAVEVDSEAPSLEEIGDEIEGDCRASEMSQTWTNAEHESLAAAIVKARLEMEESIEKYGEDFVNVKLWLVIAQFHGQSGFHREWEACKSYWQDWENSAASSDARPQSPTKAGPGDTSIELNSSNISSTWSPINAIGKDAVGSQRLAFEGPTSISSPKSTSQPQVLSSNSLSSSSIDSLSKLAKKGSEYDLGNPGPESSQIQGEDNSSRPQATTQAHGQSPATSQKPRTQAFRFQVHQRAILEAEVAVNGSSPSVERREELARNLGVEEKTVRNWFNHFRNQHRRSQGSPAFRSVLASTSNNVDSASASEVSHPDSNRKRAQISIDLSDIGSSTEDGIPDHVQSAKKPRLEGSGLITIEKPSVESTVIASPTTGDIGRNASLPNAPTASLEISAGTQEPIGVLLSSSTAPLVPATVPVAEPPPAGPPHQPTQANEGSQKISDVLDKPRDFNTATPQPTTTSSAPTSQTTPMNDKEEKAWAARKIESFQKEIQLLETESTARINAVGQIDQELKDVETTDAGLQKRKEEEIARVLKEIEARYLTEHEGLKTKQDKLKKDREKEFGVFEKNLAEIRRKKAGMGGFQAIVDYYTSLDDGS